MAGKKRGKASGRSKWKGGTEKGGSCARTKKSAPMPSVICVTVTRLHRPVMGHID